jgi:hypothetical protein
MAMEVQSDFAVALKIREANGKVHTVARYDASHKEMEGEQYAAPIPHLHRMDPTGSILASFDVANSTIQLRTPNASGLGVAREVHIDGLTGHVRQFRWLQSIDGFAIATNDDVFIVPVHPGSISDGASVRAEASSVFPRQVIGEGGKIKSIRALPTGLMVFSQNQESWLARGQVHHVRVADDTVQELTSVVPRHYNVLSANVGAGGTIRVAVNLAEDIDPPASAEEEIMPALWTFAPGIEGKPLRTEVHDCTGGDDELYEGAGEDACHVSNWVPGSGPLIYAGPMWINSPITAEGVMEGGKDLRVSLYSEEEREELDDGWGYENAMGAVDTLWTSHDEQRLLAADSARLRVWNMAGEVQWTWTAPGKQMIHGAHFDRDDRSVIVSVGKSVYRVREGKGRRIVKNRTKYKVRRLDSEYDSLAIPDSEDEGWGGQAESFVDQSIALPGGAVAFTVVDLEKRFVESDFGWDMEARLLEEELENPTGASLADPFAPSPPVPPKG